MHTRIRGRSVVLLTLALSFCFVSAALLVGCGHSSIYRTQTRTRSKQVLLSELTSAPWTVTELEGEEGLEDVLATATPSITFDKDGTVKVFTGIETLKGSWMGDDKGSLVFSLDTTNVNPKDAPANLIAARDRLLICIKRVHKYLLKDKGTELKLYDDQGAALLEAERGSRTAYLDYYWNCIGYLDEKSGGFVSPVAHSELNMVFDSDTIKGFSGTNTFNASYDVEDNHIKVYNVIGAENQALDEKLNQQQEEFYKDLKKSYRIEVSGSHLVLYDAQGIVLAEFTRGNHISGDI